MNLDITPGLFVAIVNMILIIGAVAKAATEWQKVKSLLSEHRRRLNRHSKVMLMMSKALIAQGFTMNPVHEDLEQENDENNNE
jgi:hypothetical protein